MLIYIEFISRRPGVELATFHRGVELAQVGWADAHGGDQILLNVGRTWRIGPIPGYICVWLSPDHGLERLDDWERTFSEGRADELQTPFDLAARIDHAGCYEPLTEPVAGTAGRYYAEWFELVPGSTDDAVRRLYSERRERHSDLQLNLLATRIGKLGPDPSGLAIWGLPSWRSLDGVARELSGELPVQLAASGLYADLGTEQL